MIDFYKEQIEKQAKLKTSTKIGLGLLGAGLLATPRINSEINNHLSYGNTDVTEFSPKNKHTDNLRLIRKKVQESANNNISDENVKYDFRVNRPLLFKRQNYTVSGELKNKNNPKDNIMDSIDFDINPENKKGYIHFIMANNKHKKQGYGRKSEKTIIDSMKGLGQKEVSALAAWDGPNVWTKKSFGYDIDPNKLKAVNDDYKFYCEQNKIPFKKVTNWDSSDDSFKKYMNEESFGVPIYKKNRR